MPSNAMKVSQFIAELQKLHDQHGDVDMVLAIPDAIVAIDGRNVNVTNEVQSQKLATPAIVIGQYRDERGRLTNMPGQRYEATNDGGPWNYDRAAAPQGVTLRVWRRQGGEGVGLRVEDRWYVIEGRPRPIEVPPASILAWALP